MAGMRIAIVGSRTFNNEALVRKVVRKLHARYGSDLTIVSGGARGVDTMAVDAALDLDARIQVWPAEWHRYGRSAGYRRNALIIDNADIVIALFARGPKSKGTSHTVNIASRAGKPVLVYHEGEWSFINGSAQLGLTNV